MAKPKTESRYSVPNLERALVIMEHLVDKPEGCGVTELSERLGYSKNSVFRIAKTLVMHGYLNEADKAYTVSTKLLALGYAALGEVNIIEKSFDVMHDLRDEAKETVLLGTLVGLHGVVLEQVLGSFEIKFMIDVGHVFLPHTAAPGKAMLAYLPESERQRIVHNMEYKRFNARTITTPRAMLRCLEQVRGGGFAVDRAERIEGLHGVACPIFNHWGYPVASIWITGPSFRIPVTDFDRLGRLVKRHASRISQRLGWNGGEHRRPSATINRAGREGGVTRSDSPGDRRLSGSNTRVKRKGKEQS